MSDPKKYTVGWISAVRVEFAAARSLLDEIHNEPARVQPHDANTYILGSMGAHNVVIASLPDAEYGTASAARVAANMLTSFPNVRFGLMVGIAGGAPSAKNDIRLGDVVVGVARDGENGVFEYDFGKTVQGRKFEVTRRLNQPPTILRSAVTRIQTEHTVAKPRIQEGVDAVLEGNPRIVDEFQRPPPGEDRLFKSDVIYNPTAEFHESQLVKRKERQAHQDNPAIHYGTIASANQLMKDATVRDRLIAEKNVLCFEMEAAGLVNHFPCLVVRGICDYSDSHKNDAWQGYAAMVAGVYAKQLLRTIAPSSIEVQRTIQELAREEIKNMRRDLHSLKATSERGHAEEILKWLASNSHIVRHGRAAQTRHEGPPGIGKTIMTSSVVDDLLDNTPKATFGVAVIYLDYNSQEEQSVRSLLAALLRQLASSESEVHESVKELFNERHRVPEPSIQSLEAALESLIGGLETAFLVVDALDEAQSPACRNELLAALLRLRSRVGANLFLTSRPDHQVSQVLAEVSPITKDLVGSPDDLREYLSSQLLHVYPGAKAACPVLTQAKADILNAAEGIFLIAQLYVSLLRNSGISSPEELKVVLAELKVRENSKLLDDIYSKTMARVKRQTNDLATRILTWMACSVRQMTFRELQQALAVEIIKVDAADTNTLARLPSNIVSADRIISACLGLITMAPEGDRVVFGHKTAHEYFAASQREHFPGGEDELTRTCVTMTLLFTPRILRLEKPGSTNHLKGSQQGLEQSHPFYFYAAKHWGDHARRATSSGTSTHCDLIFRFLEQADKVNATGYILQWWSGRVRHSLEGPPPLRAIHLVAYFGLEGVLERLLQTPQLSSSSSMLKVKAFLPSRVLAKREVNSVGTDLGLTPLHCAVMGNHAGMVRLLLNFGADVNKADAKGMTPRFLAMTHKTRCIHDVLAEHGGKIPWWMMLGLWWDLTGNQTGGPSLL
ncbi:hypothetical protein BJY01DRAFT_253561 [Aspergillus pseudoustus]|uniref:NACHT domain-containing protein n=1 Tax=Aspergillus pseudoustus TaxID=1810923 RepID=A0ABR4IZG2_9EURO